MKTILFLNNRYCASDNDLKNILMESRNHTDKLFRHEVLAAFKDRVMHKWCSDRGLDFGLDKIDITEKGDDDIFKSIVAAVGGKVTADITSSFNEVGELIRVECKGKVYDVAESILINKSDAKSITFVFRSKKPENNKFKFTFDNNTQIVNWYDKTTNQEVAVNFSIVSPRNCDYKLTEGAKNVFGSVIRFSPDISVEIDGVKFLMKYVEGGTFNDRILKSYYIGETQVTQGLWKAVMGNNPSVFAHGDNYPVDSVSWNDCNDFITKLAEKTHKLFRFPTVAEWEYAARGGNKSKGFKYSGSDNLNEVGWHISNSGRQTHPVQSKKPNELGLYDMSGNVFEWCQGSSGSPRVLRGGSWNVSANFCRVSYRNSSSPYNGDCNNGMRLALPCSPFPS